MSITKITCVTCPLGCDIEVEGDGVVIESLKGATCKRGVEYATNEYTHPVRILTSLVKVKGAASPLVPVRTARPVPKDSLARCMDEIRRVVLEAPVKAGTIVVPDLCGTGVAVVTTGDVE